MNKKKIILVVGRTCSGKTTISREVSMRLGLTPVKSHTTRPMRTGETSEDSDHIFICEDEMLVFQGEIVALSEISGYKYFTTKSMLDVSDIYVIDSVGIEMLRQTCWDEYDFVIIYVRAPKIVADIWSAQRGDKKDLYLKRRKDEDAQFSDFEKKMGWNYHILNTSTFENAVSTMSKMIQKELGI